MNPTSIEELESVISELGPDDLQPCEAEKLLGRENGMTNELRAAISDIPKFKEYLKQSKY